MNVKINLRKKESNKKFIKYINKNLFLVTNVIQKCMKTVFVFVLAYFPLNILYTKNNYFLGK